MPLDESKREKIALFTNVEKRAVIPVLDVDRLYKLPLELHNQHLDEIVVDKLSYLRPKLI